jgi:hypothetical protein
MKDKTKSKSIEEGLDISLQPPMALDLFRKRLGITATTAWRWRKNGTLRTINIFGRVYVTAQEMIEFNRRALNGEFSQEHRIPSPPKIRAIA